MKKIKVLNISPTMKSGGGIEEILIRYYRNINKENIQYDFLANSLAEGNLEEEILKSEGKIYKTTPYRKNLILNLYKKYKILKQNEYDVIHIHTVGASMLFDGIIARICRIKKIIFHVHTLNRKKSLLHHICTPIFRILGTDFWACSKDAAKYFFGRRIFKHDKFRVINNALDLNQYHIDINIRMKIREELNADNNFLVGFIGRLAEEKNVNFTIDIFLEILKVNPNSFLVIVGEGEEEKNLKERVINLKLIDKVIFTGVRKDIYRVMQGIDVLLMPSLFEGLGMVAIEAQALGVEIIVSDKIPIEAKITDSLHYMKLSSSPSIWADKSLSIKNNNNKDNSKIKRQIQEKGYDIKVEAKKIEKYYCL